MGTTTQSLQTLFNRKEPLIIIGGITFSVAVLAYYFDIPGLTEANSTLSVWNTVTTYFLVWTGIIGTLRRNAVHTYERHKGTWPFALYLIIVFFAYLGMALQQGVSGEFFIKWNATTQQLFGAMGKGVVAFYGFSAAYRAFRTRNPRSMIAIALTFAVVMRGSAVGEWIGPQFNTVVEWLVDFLQASSYRAYQISMGLGGILLGIRLLLGRELRVYGAEEA